MRMVSRQNLTKTDGITLPRGTPHQQALARSQSMVYGSMNLAGSDPHPRVFTKGFNC